MALTSDEKKKIGEKLGGKCTAFAPAAVRLYVAPLGGTRWQYTGICGAAAVVINRDLPTKPYFIQMFDLENFSIRFSEEIYEGMEYIPLRPAFYAFETSKCMVGLSFAKEDEAAAFQNWVTKGLPKASAQADANSISLPSNVKHVAHVGHDLSDLPAEWKQMLQTAGIKKKDLEANPELAQQVLGTLETYTKEHGALPPAPPRPPPPRGGPARPAPPQFSAPPRAPPAPAYSGGGDIPMAPPVGIPEAPSIPTAPPVPVGVPVPPPVMDSVPMAPPAPAVVPAAAKAVQPARAGLLADIRGFKKENALRKASSHSQQDRQDDSGGASDTPAAAAAGNNLLLLLRSAVVSRRQALEDDEEQSDDDWD